MGTPQQDYTWEWDLVASPEQLWPLVADTNRFDRDAGMPPVQRLDERPAPDGSLRLRVRQYGVPLDYTEEPFEWDAPRQFSVRRHFATGPLAELHIEAHLTPSDSGGTHLRYQVHARPRNALMAPAVRIQIGQLLARRFDRVFRAFDRIAVAGDPTTRSGRSTRLSAGGRARLREQRRMLLAAGAPAAPVERLLELVAEGDTLTVSRLRPLELADRWGLARRDTIEAFLEATRSGLLQFRWDVICPLCRVAKRTAPSLRSLPGEVHCETCNVDYRANFARSVELTFTTNPAIRSARFIEYCVGNPTSTPHILHQHQLTAGTGTTVGPLLPGRYRLRALDVPGGAYLRVASGREEPASVTVTLEAQGWPDAEPELAPGGTVEAANESDRDVVLIVERVALRTDTLTAADVLALQRFRDLFADEALRPGEEVEVGAVSILFTDLVGSTRLYQEIGDAVAFGRVLEHFDVLRACIDEAGGAVVKTIGDAVMAVFPAPERALAAALAANERIGSIGATADRGLMLKAGIHHGPCIAVTLNDQLDYFGSTVNLAARLQSQAAGGEIVLSDAVRRDPEVTALLAERSATLHIEESSTTLQGFESDHTLWRIRPA